MTPTHFGEARLEHPSAIVAGFSAIIHPIRTIVKILGVEIITKPAGRWVERFVTTGKMSDNNKDSGDGVMRRQSWRGAWCAQYPANGAYLAHYLLTDIIYLLSVLYRFSSHYTLYRPPAQSFPLQNISARLPSIKRFQLDPRYSCAKLPVAPCLLSTLWCSRCARHSRRFYRFTGLVFRPASHFITSLSDSENISEVVSSIAATLAETPIYVVYWLFLRPRPCHVRHEVPWCGRGVDLFKERG